MKVIRLLIAFFLGLTTMALIAPHTPRQRAVRKLDYLRGMATVVDAIRMKTAGWAPATPDEHDDLIKENRDRLAEYDLLEKFGKWFPTLTESDDSENWTMIYTDDRAITPDESPYGGARTFIILNTGTTGELLIIGYPDKAVHQLEPGESAQVIYDKDQVFVNRAPLELDMQP